MAKRAASSTSDPWKPSGFESDPWQPQEAEPDPAELIAPALQRIEKANAQALEELKTTVAKAIAQQTEQMVTWMRQLEGALLAPRRATIQRDASGVANQAVSEVIFSPRK